MTTGPLSTLWSDSLTQVTEAELGSAIVAAARAAVAAGELAVRVPDQAPLTWSKSGAYSSPLALRLAAVAGRPAPEVAGVIAKRLAKTPGIRRVDITGPGFLTITEQAPGALAAAIIAAGEQYARAEVPAPETHWPDRPRTFGNPGFSVRFAYARAAATRRRARDLRIERADPEALNEPRELMLLGLLAELPGRAGQAARENDAGPLSRQLERIADAYHDVYERCPALPVGDEEPTRKHGARLTLAEAVRISLNNGLHMLGETPRELL
ncbi:MAG: anticodon binding domain protein [Actinomycetia bacterium]|nr:anticodon binding domain protein [Actinomycetes bacterium]